VGFLGGFLLPTLVKVVAGKTMAVTCPVAGYPISSIVWEREGRQLPINDRQRVFPNGTLIIEVDRLLFDFYSS
jgi:hypothetical protein